MISEYNTVLNEVQAHTTQKKSKFICYISHVESEDQALDYIHNLKKKYYDANHHCYAYCVGTDEHEVERFSDDREPSGTAGKPIIEVLKGTGLKNIVAVVIRYFGGVLLGTGGLIKAYTDATQTALKECNIYENKLCEKIILNIDYNLQPKVNYLIHKRNQLIYDTIFSDKVTFVLFLSINEANSIKNEIIEVANGQCTISSDGKFYIGLVNDDIIVNKLK